MGYIKSRCPSRFHSPPVAAMLESKRWNLTLLKSRPSSFLKCPRLAQPHGLSAGKATSDDYPPSGHLHRHYWPHRPTTTHELLDCFLPSVAAPSNCRHPSPVDPPGGDRDGVAKKKGFFDWDFFTKSVELF